MTGKKNWVIALLRYFLNYTFSWTWLEYTFLIKARFWWLFINKSLFFLQSHLAWPRRWGHEASGCRRRSRYARQPRRSARARRPRRPGNKLLPSHTPPKAWKPWACWCSTWCFVWVFTVKLYSNYLVICDYSFCVPLCISVLHSKWKTLIDRPSHTLYENKIYTRKWKPLVKYSGNFGKKLQLL